MKTNPLILTLNLNKEATDYFTKLREQHFPPEKNYLKAHLTLFHQLPRHNSTIPDTLSAVCSEYTLMKLQVTTVMLLGNGVAFQIDSEPLQLLHQHLQHLWQDLLIPQDKHRLRPHITVQNKVRPKIARHLRAELNSSFRPFEIMGTGLSLWEYQGGPWEHYQTYSFK